MLMRVVELGAMDFKRTLATVARIVLVGAIGWGAFAFGAVYPWASWPLMCAVIIVALAGLVAPPPPRWRGLGLTGFTFALLAFFAAATVQLVPLPQGLLSSISSQTPVIVAQLDIAARLGLTTTHPLSIAPARTATSIAILASLALLVLGASRLFSITGVVGVAGAIATVGTLLALSGIVQSPFSTGKIYGFWSPLQSGAHPFGPFVNRNHFAGWMLMGLPVTLGLLGSCVARDTRFVRELRERILWLSRSEGNRILLLLGAACIMVLSLIQTTSRSGMSVAALAVAVILLSFQQRLTRRKRTVAAVVAALIVTVIAWAGTEAIASRFASSSIDDLNGRLGVWEDTLRIIHLYPVAGTGLNTYGIASVFYQQFNSSVRYLQAHNDYLQLVAEGGLLLAIPALVCVAVFIWIVRRRFADETSRTSYWIRTGAVVGLLAIALQETVEFSLQMPGNGVLFAVLCAIALHQTPRTHLA